MFTVSIIRAKPSTDQNLLYRNLPFRAWFSHHPDDEGSKRLLTVGQFLAVFFLRIICEKVQIKHRRGSP
jgi:hypothetical protein